MSSTGQQGSAIINKSVEQRPNWLQPSGASSTQPNNIRAMYPLRDQRLGTASDV